MRRPGRASRARLPCLAAAALLAVTAPPAAAQAPCPSASPTDSAAPPPSRPPDVIVRARASARSVRFRTRPDVEVALRGCAPWDTVVVTERTNLPDPVEPGVTYRDVTVAVEIRSWLDLRCLVEAAEPWGEPAPDPAERDRRARVLCARILGVSDTLDLPPDTLRRNER